MFYRILLLFIIVTFVNQAMGQNTNVADLVKCVDETTGSDNLLINGRLYVPSHPSTDGHPYLESNVWREGQVYIKGRSFKVPDLKLNISRNQLVLKHQTNSGTVQNIALSDRLVDSFELKDRLFINRKLFNYQEEKEGYFEVLYASELRFFRIQQKLLSPRSNVYPYGQFRSISDEFILIRNGEYHKIIKKKDLLACFPASKAEINKFMKSRSMKWKRMTEKQYHELLKYCDEEI